MELLQNRFPQRDISIIGTVDEADAWVLNVDGDTGTFTYADGKFTEIGGAERTLDSWTSVNQPIPPEVASTISELRAQGRDVVFQGVSREWPDGHFELAVDGQQNAFEYSMGKFTQRSGIEHLDGAPPIVLDTWLNPEAAVPTEVAEAVDVLRASGQDVELLGVSRHPPADRYELRVDGAQQQAYLYEDGRFVQHSNVPESGPIVLDSRNVTGPEVVPLDPDAIYITPGDDVAAIVAEAPEDSTIVFGPGIYEINARLDLKSGMTLLGAVDGGGTTLVGANREEQDVGVRIRGSECTISGVEAFNYAAHGISLHDADNNTVVDSHVHHNVDIGIAMWGSSGNTISGNRSNDNGLEGITIDGRSDNNVVSDNIIKHNALTGGIGGIGIDWSSGNVVSGNSISGNVNGPAAITFQNNGGDSYNNVIEDNVIEHSGGPGIWLKHQEFPRQTPDANRPVTTGPNATNNNVISGNRIDVDSSPHDAIIIDGSSSEAWGKGLALDATIVLASGEIGESGSGSLNEHNTLSDNSSTSAT